MKVVDAEKLKEALRTIWVDAVSNQLAETIDSLSFEIDKEDEQ